MNIQLEKTNQKTDIPVQLSQWESKNIFEKWTFRIVNELLNKGQRHPLQCDDLLTICGRDRSGYLLPKLIETWTNSTRVLLIPRLLMALWKFKFYEYTTIAFLAFYEGILRIASPIILGYFLTSLTNTDSPEYIPYVWAAVLGILSFVQSFNHHLLFFTAYRMGWNWKNATTALVYDNLFKLQTNNRGTSNIGAGNLVNLISNDVASFEILGL
eukprot:gene16199-33962_t